MADNESGETDREEIRSLDRETLEQMLLHEREQHRALIQSTTAILWQGDPQTLRFHFVSPEAEVLLGHPIERWTREPEFWVQHMHPDDRAWVPTFCRAASENLEPHDFEYRMIAADGRVVWLRDIVRVLARDGRPELLTGVMIDVTAAKESAQALKDLNQLQQILVEVSGELIGSATSNTGRAIRTALARVGNQCKVHRSYLIRLDNTSRTVTQLQEWTAPGVESLFDRLTARPYEHTPQMLETVSAGSVLHIHDVRGLDDAWARERQVFSGHGIRSLLIVPVRIAGSVSAYIGFDDIHDKRTWDEAAVRALQSLADIIGAAMQRESADAELREKQALLEIAGRTARIGGWIAHLDQGRIASSPEASAVVGLPPNQDLPLSGSLDYYRPESRERIRKRFAECVKHGTPYDEELEIVHGDGSVFWIREIGEAVRDETGRMTQVRGSVQDISEQKRTQEEIEFLALYDPLTHLPNRRLLHDRLGQALAACQRNQSYGACLFLDIDHFKKLNDTLGHDVGDQVLQQAALRLQTCVRQSDTVARLGGDEFMIILPDLDQNFGAAIDKARHVAEKIIETLMQPYQLGTSERQLTVSVGVAAIGEPDDNVEVLMKQADLAMYQAKEGGRNTVCIFDPTADSIMHARVTMENELRQSLEDDAFRIWYQPRVNVNDRIIGAEALVRWQHPERGIIAPSEFIDVAEETGLILPLGDMVLERACAQLAEWAEKPGLAPLEIAVNISARQFHAPGFVEQVERIIERTGARPDRLWLELTESMLIADIGDTISKIRRLKALGIRFAIDDFGTGYASLSYLKRLPVDALKIDQSFVRDVLTDSSDEAITRTIIVLAQTMHLSAIAEGVESREVHAILSEHGCQQFQGFLFGAPMTASEFEALLVDCH